MNGEQYKRDALKLIDKIESSLKDTRKNIESDKYIDLPVLINLCDILFEFYMNIDREEFVSYEEDESGTDNR